MKRIQVLNRVHRWRWLFLALVMMTFVLAACAPNHARIQLETEIFDFGDVNNGDVVSRDLTVTNRGVAPLVIEAVSTTCGCTTATLEPMTLEPGDQGTLHIVFDSGAHGPDLNGTVTRQIFLATNDPDNRDARIDFTANVLPADESPSVK